eukprot:3891464-Rhodomonas_salina.2
MRRYAKEEEGRRKEEGDLKMMWSSQQMAKNHQTHLTLPTVSAPAAREATMSTAQPHPSSFQTSASS